MAECLGLPLVTQGATLDEVAANLRQAVEIQLEGDDPAQWGLVAHPTLVATLELETVASPTRRRGVINRGGGKQRVKPEETPWTSNPWP